MENLEIKKIWGKLILALFVAIGLAVFRNVTKPEQPIKKSNYPIAINSKMVGQYPVEVGSGAGYFYDEVLEYRVWIHPEMGGKDIYNGNDYYQAFEAYEDALIFSKKTKGAEEPLVLIKQKEWVSEPTSNRYIHMKEIRLTEWKVEWLKGRKREKNSIDEFLKTNAIHGK